jgi:hypothetical protein
MNLTRRLILYLTCFAGMVGSFTLPVESCNGRPWSLFLMCVAVALVIPFLGSARSRPPHVLERGSYQDERKRSRCQRFPRRTGPELLAGISWEYPRERIAVYRETKHEAVRNL